MIDGWIYFNRYNFNFFFRMYGNGNVIGVFFSLFGSILRKKLLKMGLCSNFGSFLSFYWIYLWLLSGNVYFVGYFRLVSGIIFRFFNIIILYIYEI